MMLQTAENRPPDSEWEVDLVSNGGLDDGALTDPADDPGPDRYWLGVRGPTGWLPICPIGTDGGGSLRLVSRRNVVEVALAVLDSVTRTSRVIARRWMFVGESNRGWHLVTLDVEAASARVTVTDHDSGRIDAIDLL